MIANSHHQQPSQELETYEAALPKLLRQHEGEYVVIRGGELLKYFPGYNDALAWAYEQFGLESFFVKRVSPSEQHTVHFTRDLGPCRS
jgi:protease II